MTRRRHRLLDRKWLFLISLILIFRIWTSIACLVFLVLGAYNQNMNFLFISGGCLGLFLFLQVIHIMESGKIICPNCRSQILTSRRCAKHRQAKKFCGSYSLRVALGVVFTNSFLCQSCHQPYQWRGERRDKTPPTDSSN